MFDAKRLQDERGEAFPRAMRSLGLHLPKAYQRGTTLSEEGALGADAARGAAERDFCDDRQRSGWCVSRA